MKIRRLLPNSLIDYPGKISCVIFLGGCNFNCDFCFVKQLLRDEGEEISQDEVFKFLEGRRAFLDGVVVTGGEPTINTDLPEFLYRIKSLGYKVRLYTNGSNPAMLRELLKEELVDSVAIDIKAKLDDENYGRVAKYTLSENVKESVRLVRESGVEKEFRVVMFPGRSEEEVGEIEKVVGKVRRMEYLEGE